MNDDENPIILDRDGYDWLSCLSNAEVLALAETAKRGECHPRYNNELLERLAGECADNHYCLVRESPEHAEEHASRYEAYNALHSALLGY